MVIVYRPLLWSVQDLYEMFYYTRNRFGYSVQIKALYMSDFAVYSLNVFLLYAHTRALLFTL